MNIVEPIRKLSDIEKIKNERDCLLFVMGINFGLKISDLLKLRIEDVKNKIFFWVN